MDKNKVFFLFLGLIVLFLISKTLFDFLDISFSNYAIYLYWITTVVIFILVLPDKTGKMFS